MEPLSRVRVCPIEGGEPAGFGWGGGGGDDRAGISTTSPRAQSRDESSA